MLVIEPKITTIYEIILISRVLLFIVEKTINPSANTVKLAINVKLFLKLFNLS